mgnify:CR=1 FL=1
MRGYESQFSQGGECDGEFRIPMRGYELICAIQNQTIAPVPNPHEGL